MLPVMPLTSIMTKRQQLTTRSPFLALLVFVGYVISSCAAIPSANNTSLATTQLDNGVQVIAWQDQQSTEAEFRLLVHTGSLVEEAGQRGYAHLIEHLAFRGTQHFPKVASINLALKELGIIPGLHSNAYTHFDHTEYRLVLREPSLERQQLALNLLADWAQHITLSGADISAELRVIEQERALLNENNLSWQGKLFEALYAHSPYTYKEPLGERADLNRATPERLRDFYQTWYRPKNVTIIATGNIEPEKILAQTKEKFSNWPMHSAPSVKPAEIAPAKIDHYIAVTDPHGGPYAISAGFIQAEPMPQNIQQLFAQTPWSLGQYALHNRYKKRLAAENQSFYSINVTRQRLSPNWVRHSLTAQMADRNTERAIVVLAEEIERLRREGISEPELQRAKTQWLEEQFQLKTSASSLANNARDHALSGTPLIDHEHWLVESSRIVKTITAEQVKSAILARIGKEPDHFLLINIPPDSDPNQASERLKNLYQSVKQAPLPAIVSAAGRATQTMQVDAAPGHISNSQWHPDINTTELTLSNGLRVFHRRQPSDGNVAIRLTGQGGLQAIPAALTPAAQVAFSALGDSGLGDHSPSALENILAQHNVGLDLELGHYMQSFGIFAPADQLDFALRLNHHLINGWSLSPQALARNPVLDPSAHAPTNPEQALEEMLQTALYPNNLAATDNSPDAVTKALTLLTKSAGPWTLAVVGDVKLSTLKPLLRQYMANLPFNLPVQRSSSAIIPSQSADKERHWPTSDSVHAELVIIPTLQRGRLADAELMQLFSTLLQSHLDRALRDQKALVYQVAVYAEGGLGADRLGRLRIRYTTARENLDNVEQTIQTVLQQVAEQGPSNREILWQADSLRLDLEKALTDPNEVAWRLAAAQSTNVTPAYVLHPERRYQQFGAANIKKLAQQLLTDSVQLQHRLRP